MTLHRRHFLKNALALSGLPFAGCLLPEEVKKTTFRIGACDWSLGKNADPGVFEVARQIGLDGIMVNMGTVGNDMHLRQPSMQEKYLTESKRTGIAISSLALGELNVVPYKSDPRTEKWVWDSVEVARNLSVPVVLLAFFSNNDLRNDPAGKKEVITRLRRVMPHAEKNKIILGIESYLSADEHLDILQQVGSPNLKVYYDFRNTADAGFDTIQEFKKLGRERICELHMKENGSLLKNGGLNWKDILKAVHETGYTGDSWMQIEGSVPDGADLITSYKKNLAYLRSLF